MNEKIFIQNFGPISNIEIEIKDINIFIGTTSSGKSTVAKLISVFKSDQLQNTPEWFQGSVEERAKYLLQFNRLLFGHNIDFPIKSSTFIRYEINELFYEIKAGVISSNYSSYHITQNCNPVYIPAERNFFSTLSQSIFSLISSDVSLPKWLLDFGKKFEKARREIKLLDVSFLDIKYSFSDGQDIIELKNKETIKLSQGSSGLQSTIPLMMVIQHLTENISNIDKEISNDLFVVEEPEMNLYPSTQKELLEFIIRRINRCGDKLIITTHSPYILTALDNLVQAGNIDISDATSKVLLQKIVAESLWTNFDTVSCYFFDNGMAKSTLDTELRSLGPSKIDDVSEKLSSVFDAIFSLKYPSK